MRYLLHLFFWSFLLLSIGCIGPKEINSNGLKYARLGMKMPEEGQKRLKGHAIRDTVFNEGGYQWRASILKFPKGKVYLEEDFTGTNTVGRIRIEAPALSFKKAYGVGTPAGNLGDLSDEWFAYYLRDYELLDFSSNEFPGLHFLVRDTKYTGEQAGDVEIQLKDLTNTSKIVAIVVM